VSGLWTLVGGVNGLFFGDWNVRLIFTVAGCILGATAVPQTHKHHPVSSGGVRPAAAEAPTEINPNPVAGVNVGEAT